MATNEDKMFTLMEKVYSELINFKSEVNGRFDKVDIRLDKVENRLTKLEVTQEKMQGDIKGLAEGIVTNRESLDRKIDEAVDKINARDDVQDKAIYKLVKMN